MEIEIGGPIVQGHSWICNDVLVWLKLYETLKLTLPNLKGIKRKNKKKKEREEKWDWDTERNGNYVLFISALEIFIQNS